MAEVRVQARFQLAPGDGTNAATNTFHFNPPGTYEDNAEACAFAVQTFYQSNAPGLSISVGNVMADTVLRAYELRVYDLSLPAPRVPEVFPLVLPAPQVATSRMPLDVACCVSYTGAPPVTGRRRGRIFLPGVHEGWMNTGGPSAVPLFQTGAGTETDTVVRSARRLIDAGVGWSIRSVAGGVDYVPIVAGYIDVEPDTMRRRGLGSGAPRVPFPAGA